MAAEDMVAEAAIAEAIIAVADAEPVAVVVVDVVEDSQAKTRNRHTL